MSPEGHAGACNIVHARRQDYCTKSRHRQQEGAGARRSRAGIGTKVLHPRSEPQERWDRAAIGVGLCNRREELLSGVACRNEESASELQFGGSHAGWVRSGASRTFILGEAVPMFGASARVLVFT